MKKHEFSLIVGRDESSEAQPNDYADWFEEVAERLAERMNGLPDVSVMGHTLGLELAFHREGETLESVLASAIADARSVGLQIIRVELDEDAINATLHATP